MVYRGPWPRSTSCSCPAPGHRVAATAAMQAPGVRGLPCIANTAYPDGLAAVCARTLRRAGGVSAGSERAPCQRASARLSSDRRQREVDVDPEELRLGALGDLDGEWRGRRNRCGGESGQLAGRLMSASRVRYEAKRQGVAWVDAGMLGRSAAELEADCVRRAVGGNEPQGPDGSASRAPSVEAPNCGNREHLIGRRRRPR